MLKEFLLVIVMWAVTLFAFGAHADPYTLSTPSMVHAAEEMATPLPWSLRLGGAVSVRSRGAAILLDLQGGRRFRPGDADSVVSVHLIAGVRSTPQASDGSPTFVLARTGVGLELDLTKFMLHVGSGVEVGSDGGRRASGMYTTASLTFLGDLLEARATYHWLWNDVGGHYTEATVTLSINLWEAFRSRSARGS